MSETTATPETTVPETTSERTPWNLRWIALGLLPLALLIAALAIIISTDGGIVGDDRLQFPRIDSDNGGQFLDRVEFEMLLHAEPIAHRDG